MKIASGNKNKAFGLLELSVVITIIAVVVVAVMATSIGKVSNRRNKVTNDRIEVIYKALKNYVATNKKFPCPASIVAIKSTSTYGDKASSCTETITGVSVLTSGSITGLSYGLIPVKSLGLSVDAAEDGFGNKYMYIVDTNFTGGDVDFVNDEGRIVIKKYNNGLSVVESNAIFAIVSYGANQQNAIASTAMAATTTSNSTTSPDEYLNATAYFDGNLISYSNRLNDSKTFDDIVFYKNKDDFLWEANLHHLKDSNSTQSAKCGSGYQASGNSCVAQ